MQEEPGVEEDLATAEQAALSGVSLGIATGAIAVTGNQPLSNFSEQAICEFSNLGAKWIRIEADPTLVAQDPDVLRRIVQKAHAKNIKVLVTVPVSYCGADTPDAFGATMDGYVAQLNALATNTFTGTATADAYEIGNKPNLIEACASGGNGFRVQPKAFASLLRKAWNWKTSNARTELIISGGIKDVYLNAQGALEDPYWNAFFSSTDFSGFPGVRPFDYFGIQPYNSKKMDYNCINSKLTTCFTPWKNATRDGLVAVANRVNSATGTTGSKLFVTEFGFQVITGNACTDAQGNALAENCTLLNSLPAGSPPYQQLAAGMNAAGDSFVLVNGLKPNTIEYAIWHDYRDDASGGFGLRSTWDATTNKYLVKTAGWNKFRSLAGGTGSTNSEACWIQGSYFPVDFENGDTLRSTSAGDWAYGYYKGECAPGERIMGVSKSIANGWSRLGICYKDPLDSGRYQHPTPTLPVCSVRNVLNGSDRGPTPTHSGDWDPGNYLAECKPTEYVAGVAQTTDHKFSHVLCCPATVSASSCTTVAFGGADNRQATDSGNWDAAGHKGECGVGRYVAGVSRTPAGQPNALLCCNQ